MIEKRRLTTAALTVAVLTLAAAGVRAVYSQSAPPPATKTYQVRENLAPHPAPEQPIPFSHKKHVSMGLQCAVCHTNPELGAQMTLPPTQTCMGCHTAIATDRPAIMKLTESSKAGRPIEWVRVYELMPGVTWNHRTHLQAGMQCTACHGEVGQLDHMAKLTSVTAMASCIGCHEAHGAPITCQTCHAWPLDGHARDD